MSFPDVRTHTKRHASDSEHGDGTWIFSYADMITILMIFFILIISISNVSAEKFSNLQDSMNTRAAGAGKAKTDTKKSVDVSDELKKMASEKSPTLAGVPLDAVAKKAAETGGDRLTQLSAGVRILLDSVSKEFLQRDQRLASEFEMLKKDFQQLEQLSAGRALTKSHAPEIVLSIPSDQAFNAKMQVSPALQQLARTIVEKMNSLQVRPALRLETHTSRWDGKRWRSESEARERSILQSMRLTELLVDLGADANLLSVAAYGLRKPIVDEQTARAKDLPAAARSNERIVLVLERRPIILEKQAKEKIEP